VAFNTITINPNPAVALLSPTEETRQIISAVSIVARVLPVMMRSFASIQTCLTKKHFKNRNHIHIITKPCRIIIIMHKASAMTSSSLRTILLWRESYF